MKVGIITFHRAVNYGAALQAYALQRAIEKKGHEVEIIDYRCPKIESDVSPMAGFADGERFVSATKKCVFRIRKKMAFSGFFRKYVNLSAKAESQADLSKLSEKYDVIYTGSDQVWNYGCSGSDTAYFLDFVKDNHKKNAYAASFGMDKLSDDDPFDYKTLLTDFNCISVREKSAVSIIENVSGRQSEVVLDPTLLLDKKEWKNVVAKRPIKEKYIFVYYIRKPKDLLKYANELSEKTGYKIINAKSSIEFFKKCSPSDFLSWIYYSEYFVTNSFHGTVFSLVFHKKFAIELNNGKDTNNRSKELLDLVGVDRDTDRLDVEAIDSKIDYKTVDEVIRAEREKSLSFIEKTIC